MRELFLLEKPLAWDDIVPDDMKKVWIDLMVETLMAGDLHFHRGTRPPAAEPSMGPTVVGFAGFSLLAYEARVYLRWQLSGSPSSVPPLRGLTIPRGELTSLTLLSRLMLKVIMALQKVSYPPTSSIMMVDSKCSISAVQTTKPLLPYFQNRVAEIRDNMDLARKLCPMEDIHYVESALNPSDMSTRATANIAELGPDSIYQSGPEFLCLPRSVWPVSRDFCRVELPSDEVRARDGVVFAAALRTNFSNPASAVQKKNPWAVIEELLHYSNDIKKITRIIARYLRGLEAGFRKSQIMTIENTVAYNLIAPEPRAFSRPEIRGNAPNSGQMANLPRICSEF